MNNRTPLKIPLRLLVLDAIGLVLVGVGLADWLAGTQLVPAGLRFEDYEIVMIIIGVALMVPMYRHIIGYVRAGGAHGRRPG